MPERFRGELLIMGRYTNQLLFFPYCTSSPLRKSTSDVDLITKQDVSLPFLSLPFILYFPPSLPSLSSKYDRGLSALLHDELHSWTSLSECSTSLP